VRELVSGPCGKVAARWGADFVVAGSFATTVGRVRDAYPNSRGLVDASTPDSSSALVCFVDGDFPLAPPPDGASASNPPDYDRAAILSIGEFVTLLQAGYRDRMPVRFPPQQ
jgi:hypothetical protein